MELFVSLLIFATPPPEVPSAPFDLLELAPPQYISGAANTAGATASAGLVDPTELDTLRGGDGFTAVISDQTLTAINSGNTLTASTIGSGDINLGQGAFSGFAGLGNFAINTGHNNNLQSSVSISINITAPVGP